MGVRAGPSPSRTSAVGTILTATIVIGACKTDEPWIADWADCTVTGELRQDGVPTTIEGPCRAHWSGETEVFTVQTASRNEPGSFVDFGLYWARFSVSRSVDMERVLIQREIDGPPYPMPDMVAEDELIRTPSWYARAGSEASVSIEVGERTAELHLHLEWAWTVSGMPTIFYTSDRTILARASAGDITLDTVTTPP